MEVHIRTAIPDDAKEVAYVLNKEHDIRMIHTKPSLRILLVALFLGWIVDLLFYNKIPGISVPLFVLLLTAALFGLGQLEGLLPLRRNLWLLLPLFFFATMVFVRANIFVTSLNLAFCLMLTGHVVHFYAADKIEKLGLTGYALIPLRVAVNALIRTGTLVSSSFDVKAMSQRGRNLLPLVRGILLALPVLVVFIALLSSADIIFADYLEKVLKLDLLSHLPELLWRGVIILTATWFVAGGFAYAFSRGTASGEEGISENTPEEASVSSPKIISLGFIETATVLTLVNLLFLVFVAIQFAYLFGGHANIIGEDFTYAEYARRGFFELLAVSMLSLCLILGFQWLGRRETIRRKRIFGCLCSVMVGLVLVILASAFQRLRLYEATYGYTQLRLYSHIFMIWLAAVFVWLVFVLWSRPSRFGIGAFIAALGFLITLNIINPDDFIVKRNLAHYQSTGRLDISYLGILSEDAVPALISAMDKVTREEQKALRRNLSGRLKRMDENTRWQSWPSFHLSRRRTHKSLQSISTSHRLRDL